MKSKINLSLLAFFPLSLLLTWGIFFLVVFRILQNIQTFSNFITTDRIKVFYTSPYEFVHFEIKIQEFFILF